MENHGKIIEKIMGNIGKHGKIIGNHRENLGKIMGKGAVKGGLLAKIIQRHFV